MWRSVASLAYRTLPAILLATPSTFDTTDRGMDKATANEAFVRDFQIWLKQSRSEPVTVDAFAGNQTRACAEKHLAGFPTVAAPAAEQLARIIAPVDERSERNILTLLPPVQDKAREFIRQLHERGWDFRITSGTRSYAEQDALYRQAHDGKDNDGDGRIDEADETVTKAPAGYSNHNFGLAIDITLFEGKNPVWDSPLYREASQIGKALGFDWGGDWTSIKDLPHYEMRPAWAKGMPESAMLTDLRRRVAGNLPIFE